MVVFKPLRASHGSHSKCQPHVLLACSNPKMKNHMDVSIPRSDIHEYHYYGGSPQDQTTKWLHRQFRWIIPFGRACLIPNLRYVPAYCRRMTLCSSPRSYISEAAASLLDERLNLNIVPRTQLVSLSSQVLHANCLGMIFSTENASRLSSTIG